MVVPFECSNHHEYPNPLDSPENLNSQLTVSDKNDPQTQAQAHS